MTLRDIFNWVIDVDLIPIVVSVVVLFLVIGVGVKLLKLGGFIR